jgi:hypothetical protein
LLARVATLDFSIVTCALCTTLSLDAWPALTLYLTATHVSFCISRAHLRPTPAWAGAWNEVFAPDISATLDSFIVTQDLSRTRLVFWFLEKLPRKSSTFDAIVERFSTIAPAGVIEFRQADLTELASATCVAHTPELWTTRGSIPLQTKSDVFRLLVLHKHSGIWIDTDTILLRDVTPVWEYGGEFGGKFAMTLKYNNAFLGLRKNSSLSTALLGLICQHPQSSGRWQEYCAVVGAPCHLGKVHLSLPATSKI